MASYVNTYGTKKKKRRFIPKYIIQGSGTDDVFEALNMEKIKESKASLDEKAKLKLKKKRVPIKKPALSLGSYNDAVFDELLESEPFTWCSPSSSFVFPMSVASSCPSLSNVNKGEGEGNEKEEANGESRRPISPILSTSTPFWKSRAMSSHDLASDSASQAVHDVSADLFSSHDHKDSSSVVNQNVGAASMDMFSSLELGDDRVFHSVNPPARHSHCRDANEPHSFGVSSVCKHGESKYVVPLEDSSVILCDSPPKVCDTGHECDADSDASLYQEDNSLIDLGSRLGELSCVGTSPPIRHEICVRKCHVMLSRCDVKISTPDHAMSAISSPNVSINLEQSKEVSVLEDSEHLNLACPSDETRNSSEVNSVSDALFVQKCSVVLSRCDKEMSLPDESMESSINSCFVIDNSTNLQESIEHCKSQCDSKELQRKFSIELAEMGEDEAESSVVSLPHGALTGISGTFNDNEHMRVSSDISSDLDNVHEQHQYQVPLLQVSAVTQDLGLNSIHEAVLLKPGKKWRRSLSILKTRLSGGASSPFHKRSLPASEVILEDVESSLGSLCLDNTAGSNMSSASVVLGRCGQVEPVPFVKFYPESMKKNCRKIGEGVYGEVFVHSDSGNPDSVIKIIPIEGEMEVNGCAQKTYEEIFSEICVAQELSNLRRGTDNVAVTFNQVQNIRCVQGCYPEWLQELWHDYNDSKGSENDCPDMFLEHQLYIILELGHGGKDLESFVFSSADQGLSAFKQIALSIAVGESALSFEHRDLHWGNVLISSTKKKEVGFILNGEVWSTPSKGIEVSIIDFTLSRINEPSTGNAISYDLSRDETLFTAQGDYQFEIYRMMKDYCGNKWDTFTPKTNIAWLHYLLDKFCTMVRYRNRSSKVHSRAIDVLSEMKDTILMFDSACSFVKCGLFHK